MKKLILGATALAVLAGSAYAGEFTATGDNKISSVNVVCDDNRTGFLATITNSSTDKVVKVSSCDSYEGKRYAGGMILEGQDAVEREQIPAGAIYHDINGMSSEHTYTMFLPVTLSNPEYPFDSSKYDYSSLEDSGVTFDTDNMVAIIEGGNDYGPLIEILQKDKTTGEEKVLLVEIYTD